VGGASGTFAVNKGTSKTEALSFLYDYDVMVIISINFRTGNTVSLLTFFIGENNIFTGWIEQRGTKLYPHT
jgi:hypothetical protein